ncbi:MAG: hypothetical protein HY986_09735 [Candidatus Melainabacteria bacterium]|nr:hypothetical protein [Candidatus Melainabacteria bacterium]
MEKTLSISGFLGTGSGRFKQGPVAYSAAQIASMCSNGGTYNGFTAEVCGNCQAKANVFALDTEWFCACGHFNCQSWSDSLIPHEHPDYGPELAVIRAGHTLHEEAIADLIARERPGWTAPSGDLCGFAREMLRREFALLRGMVEWASWGDILYRDRKLAA